MVEQLQFPCKETTLIFPYQICGQSCVIEAITAARRNKNLTSRKFSLTVL